MFSQVLVSREIGKVAASTHVSGFGVNQDLDLLKIAAVSTERVEFLFLLTIKCSRIPFLLAINRSVFYGGKIK
jgi:hypothetical protein